MHNYLVSREKFAELLGKSRISAGISQRELAKRMKKSVGTIQNWEACLSTPDTIDALLWFDCIGINSMKYFVEFIYPDDIVTTNTKYNNEEENRAVLIKWVTEIASKDEMKKMRFNILGNTGSSWHSQVDLLTMYNKLPLEHKIMLADIIYNLYILEYTKGNIDDTEVEPNIVEVRKAIEKCKEAVLKGFKEYNN